MAILHGSWLLQEQRSSLYTDVTRSIGRESAEWQSGCFLIWGETWRRIEADSLASDDARAVSHPFAMTRDELAAFLTNLQKAGNLRLPVSLLEQAPEPLPATKSRSRKGNTAVALQEAQSERTIAQTRFRVHKLSVSSYEAEGESAMNHRIVPQHSAANSESALFLHPWLVDGIYLTPLEAVHFLNSLPLSAADGGDSFLGGDLRFWSHIARWSLDLLARSKFLPGVERLKQERQASEATEDSYTAAVQWQPLLDSAVDQNRLLHFIDRMPVACRTYQQNLVMESTVQDADSLTIDLPPDSQALLQSFLNAVLDAQIRAVAQNHLLSAEPARNAPPGISAPVKQWLQALAQETAIASVPALEALEISLKTWTTPLQHRRAESLFQTCLYLHPPRPGRIDWQLEYFLQSVTDPDFLVDAPTIWSNPVERFNYRGRMIFQPQETLLMGLGLASRLFAPIEPSLQEPRPQFCLLNPQQAYDFIKTAAWRLQDSGLGVVLPPSLASQGGWANRLGLKIQAQTAKFKKTQRLGLQSLLNFRWELSIGGQTLSKEEFDRLVALNTPLVEINGEWVELRPQDIRAAQTFFASRKDQTNLSLEDALRISTGDTQTMEKLPVVSFEASGALQELITTLTGNRAIEPLPAPASFRGELRPYQARGVGWLAFLEQWGLGACLADDMGLGKTIQLIAFLLHLQEQKALEKPTLLVCPTSVLGNWEREVKRFGPSLKTLLHHGDTRPKGKAFAKAIEGMQLVITSYALLYRDLKDLQTVSWQGIVLDEAQNVKNPEAKQSQAVRQLEADCRIALTGTPVENRLSELWSIMDFLNPGYLGPRNFFQRRFSTPIERYGDTASLQTLRSLVQPFILRRLKTDRDIIQDLPEKQEMTVFCGLTSEQAALYQNIVDQSLTEIDTAEGIQRKGIILALLVKLKQICNHPALFLKDDKQQGTSSFHSRSGKLQRLEEMLEEVVAEGDRALIFTQFAEWGKLLKTFLEQQMGREVLFLYGSTSKKQREEMVDRFQHDPQGPRLFILSLKAGGVGLNLTRANHVFHFDRWWNPAVENQATDRVFRIGQTRNVQVHKFVSTGTLEEKIHDLIESKRALAEQVVGAGENWLTELDTDQLRNLLLLDRSAVIGEE